MIPQTSTLTVSDTLPGKETEFRIGDPAWVMEALSDLYSNKELAVIREISTNARDSQVEAGNADKPIVVTLPTLMNPYFKVKDCGVGMSVSELEEVYTSFGTSTKRDSNDFNGLLGFGSKAPIAYTGTFTVTTVKDGIKAVAVITKKPGKMILKVVMTSKTDEPSGVEISVPVHNHESFSRIAKDFYRFWFPGTVLVDGVEPKQAVGEKINDNLYYSTTPGVSYVVMGNVAYRIANPAALFQSSKMSALSFVAFVENGSVEFTPSREDLKYTDHTKATLHKVIADFENKMVTQSRKEIEKAKNHMEAWAAWDSWSERLGRAMFAGMEYKGDKFISFVPVTGTHYKIPVPGDYNSRYNTQRINQHSMSQMKNTLIVHNFGLSLNAHHKAKMREFRKHVDFHFKFVVFTADKFESKWVEDQRIVTWEQVKATIPKKPKQPRAAGPTRIPGTFDYYTKARKEYEKALPSGATVFYVTAMDARTYDVTSILRLLDNDGIVVVLAKNRVAKFTKENPKTQDFIAYAKSLLVLDGNSLITDETKKALAVGHGTRRWLNYLDVNKIDDPAFAATKELIKPQAGAMREYEKHQELARCLKNYGFVRNSIRPTDESLIKGYPLLDMIGSYSAHAHIYIYLNAAYAESKKGNNKK